MGHSQRPPRLRLLHQVLTCRCSTAVRLQLGQPGDHAPSSACGWRTSRTAGPTSTLTSTVGEGVFSIRPAFRTLVGKARVTLCCVFQPTQPIIYWRRVACLIHHQVSCRGGAGASPQERGQSETWS